MIDRNLALSVPAKDKVTKVPSLKMSTPLYDGLYQQELKGKMNSANSDKFG